MNASDAYVAPCPEWQQGWPDSALCGRCEFSFMQHRCSWTLTDIHGTPWICTKPPHDAGPGSLHDAVPVRQSTPKEER